MQWISENVTLKKWWVSFDAQCRSGHLFFIKWLDYWVGFDIIPLWFSFIFHTAAFLYPIAVQKVDPELLDLAVSPSVPPHKPTHTPSSMNSTSTALDQILKSTSTSMVKQKAKREAGLSFRGQFSPRLAPGSFLHVGQGPHVPCGITPNQGRRGRSQRWTVGGVNLMTGRSA